MIEVDKATQRSIGHSRASKWAYTVGTVTPSNPVPVRITAAQLGATHRQLESKAAERTRQMRGRDSTYGWANVESNYVGLLGEVACQRWFESQGEPVEALYLWPRSRGDLLVISTKMLVEVKTSRLPWWQDHGTLLSPRQMPAIADEDALMWCVVGPNLPTSAVYIMGWVPAPELVERVKPVVSRGTVSLRLSHLDDVETLMDWMSGSTSRFSWTNKAATYECKWGHTGRISVCLQCWWRGIGGPSSLSVEGRHYHLDEGCVQAESARIAPAGTALQNAMPCSVCVKPWLEDLEVGQAPRDTV